MIKHIITALFKIPAFMLAELPVQAAGLIVNAIAIPFRRIDDDLSNDGVSRPYSQYPELGDWVRVRLPKWALWFDNPYDGLLGDKRGWWANECRKHERTERNFVSMYIWSAIRNPANYFSRCVTGVDVSDCVIEKLAGNADVVDDSGKSGISWHFLVATDSKNRNYHLLYGVVPYPFKPEKMLSFKLGWKIKLEHNGTSKDARGQDRYKGNTFRIALFDDVEQG